MNRERTLGSIDQDLQHGISHSNTWIDVSLEVLTDDDKKASKQSSSAQNHQEASIDQKDLSDFVAVDCDDVNDLDFQTKIGDGKITPQKTNLVQNDHELAAEKHCSKPSVYHDDDEQEHPIPVNNSKMAPKEDALMQKSQEVTLEDRHFDLSIHDDDDDELEFQSLAKYLKRKSPGQDPNMESCKRRSKAMLSTFIKGHFLMHLLFLKARNK